MCLAVPGKVVALEQQNGVLMGKIDFNGVSKRACLEHVPDAAIGDYVLVHVGFALSRVDPVEAERVFEFLRSIDQLDDAKPNPSP